MIRLEEFVVTTEATAEEIAESKAAFDAWAKAVNAEHAATLASGRPPAWAIDAERKTTRQRRGTRAATAAKSRKAEADATPFLRRFDLHVAEFERDPNTWNEHEVAVRAVCTRIARAWRGSLEAASEKKKPAPKGLDHYVLTAELDTVIARFVRWVEKHRGVISKDSLRQKAREANAERYGGGYSAYADEMRRRR